MHSLWFTNNSLPSYDRICPRRCEATVLSEPVVESLVYPQVQVANAFLVLMLSLGCCFTWCFRVYLLNLWFQAKRSAPSLPPVCQSFPVELRCIFPLAKIAVKFGALPKCRVHHTLLRLVTMPCSEEYSTPRKKTLSFWRRE